MGHSEAESEYVKLKGLLETLSVVGEERDRRLLHDAEMALKANGSEALDNLERNLRNVRVRILSELEQIKKNFE